MTQFVSERLGGAFLTGSHTADVWQEEHALFTSKVQLGLLIFSGTNFLLRAKLFPLSLCFSCFQIWVKSHFLSEREHMCLLYVWESEAVCGSVCVCVPVMVLPCAESPCMGLNEVGYERNCQIWATVGKPPSITSSSSFSSSSFCFTSEDCRKTSRLYILVSMLYIILRLQCIIWQMLKTNVVLELYHCN